MRVAHEVCTQTTLHSDKSYLSHLVTPLSHPIHASFPPMPKGETNFPHYPRHTDLMHWHHCSAVFEIKAVALYALRSVPVRELTNVLMHIHTATQRGSYKACDVIWIKFYRTVHEANRIVYIWHIGLRGSVQIGCTSLTFEQFKRF